MAFFFALDNASEQKNPQPSSRGAEVSHIHAQDTKGIPHST